MLVSNKMNKQENLLIKSILNILILFYNVSILKYFFVYTYYITFHIIIIDIFLILRFININSENMVEYCKRAYILILIFLIYIPLVTILYFYRLNKNWMNYIILLILVLLLLLILILSYYSKLFFIFVLLFICLLLLFICVYVGLESVNLVFKKNKFIISIIISFLLFYLNNS